jgi:hypothetical protein
VSTLDAAAILDDVVTLIGEDVQRTKALVAQAGTGGRVLTGEEARILAGYARALVDVARARKAADEDGLTPEEERAIAEIEKLPEAREILSRTKGSR